MKKQRPQLNRKMGKTYFIINEIQMAVTCKKVFPYIVYL